ncbi:hypothetical protein EYF80_010573 [Liparis tanakae]|uniref:Uncharacterized protein n=1 Tax=Liparis tanakae TaxID=230148 RepID=A0A4Z2IMP7_9TELE|nr:hypothetical protein EYF80_010573 [Liparis tanakae]
MSQAQVAESRSSLSPLHLPAWPRGSASRLTGGRVTEGEGEGRRQEDASSSDRMTRLLPTALTSTDRCPER